MQLVESLVMVVVPVLKNASPPNPLIIHNIPPSGGIPSK
jgi:hypothetical protein